MSSNYSEIFKNGLWKNNPVLIQLLGLCPLLAVSSSITNALGLGIATIIVLILSNGIVSLVRALIPKEIRIPVFVMIIASLVTGLQLLMNAYAHNLYISLGIFIPLIVTNCIIIGRAESFASKNSFVFSLIDGLATGLGIILILIVLGASREILGQGTLFNGANILFGPWAEKLKITLIKFDSNFLLAILPPGAFLGLGFMIAIKNVISNRKS